MNPNPKQECFMNSRSRAPPIQELNQRITKKIASRAPTNLLEVSHQINEDQNLPPLFLSGGGRRVFIADLAQAAHKEGRLCKYIITGGPLYKPPV